MAPQHRDIRERVRPHDLGAILAAIEKPHEDLARSIDYVVVRHYVTVASHDEPGADAGPSGTVLLLGANEDHGGAERIGYCGEGIAELERGGGSADLGAGIERGGCRRGGSMGGAAGVGEGESEEQVRQPHDSTRYSNCALAHGCLLLPEPHRSEPPPNDTPTSKC